MLATAAIRCPAVRASFSPRRALRRTVTVRASGEPAVEQQQEAAPAQQTPEQLATASSSAPAAAAAAAAQPFSLLGVQQEAINGRAAMLGFLVAIATELTTQQSVWSQIAGKYVDRDLVEKPLSFSVLFFGFVVVATALASFAPQVYKGEGPAARSFGPFTPKAELSNGRAAMIGFLALLAVEFFRGNVALF
ncbi:hypothetical protein ABPG75_002086 [Micractinium tetrahymenae]